MKRPRAPIRNATARPATSQRKRHRPKSATTASTTVGRPTYIDRSSGPRPSKIAARHAVPRGISATRPGKTGVEQARGVRRPVHGRRRTDGAAAADGEVRERGPPLDGGDQRGERARTGESDRSASVERAKPNSFRRTPGVACPAQDDREADARQRRRRGHDADVRGAGQGHAGCRAPRARPRIAPPGARSRARARGAPTRSTPRTRSDGRGWRRRGTAPRGSSEAAAQDAAAAPSPHARARSSVPSPAHAQWRDHEQRVVRPRAQHEVEPGRRIRDLQAGIGEQRAAEVRERVPQRPRALRDRAHEAFRRPGTQ